MADVICDETVFLLSCCDLTSRSLCNIYAIMTPFRWLHHQEFGVRYVEHSLIKVVIFVKRTSLFLWNPSSHYITASSALHCIPTTLALHCQYNSTTEALHWWGKFIIHVESTITIEITIKQSCYCVFYLPFINTIMPTVWLHMAIRLLSSREASCGAPAF